MAKCPHCGGTGKDPKNRHRDVARLTEKGLNGSQIGEKLGISRQRVSQIRKENAAEPQKAKGKK